MIPVPSGRESGSAEQKGRAPDPPVFLLAPARSYSTVTLALLAGHPHVYGFPEMLLFSTATVRGLLEESARRPHVSEEWRWTRLSGVLRAVADLTEDSQSDAAIARARRWLEQRGRWTTTELMNELLLRAHPLLGIEKSPDTVHSDRTLDACIAAFPGARYLHLTRHPVSTQRSMQAHRPKQRGERPANPALEAAAAWYLGHRRIVDRLSALPSERWMRVRAEDLLREPRRWIPRVLTWLGLPYDKRDLAQMMCPHAWRFAGTGPSGRLFGGDPGFMHAPELRAVPAPGPVSFDPSWNLPLRMRRDMTDLAEYMGYGEEER